MGSIQNKCFSTFFLKNCLLIFSFGLFRADFHSLNDNKIVGGKAAVEGQFPYQVALCYNNGVQFCGGAIYNEMTIISASHCSDGLHHGSVKVVAGELGLAIVSGNEQEATVASILMHPCLLYTSPSPRD